MTIFHSLPFDSQLEILRYPVAVRQFSIREVCKDWKRKAEECLKRHFIMPLKRFNIRLQAPVPIASLAQSFDESRHCSLREGVQFFKKINDAFSKYNIHSKPLAITAKEFEDLELEAKKSLDMALAQIWLKIREQIPAKDSLPASNATPEAIREWLSDPVNRATLERIKRLDLKSVDLDLLPPEIQFLINLEKLDISSKVKNLPEEIFNLPQLHWIISKFNQELSAADYESRGPFLILT